MKKFNEWIYNTPIAHRGLHNEFFPENTEGAFLNAISHGYAIETDVQMTKDGVLVIHHDNDLKRSLNIEKNIRDLNYCEFKDLCPFNGEYKFQTFKEFLTMVDGQVPIMLEIKNQKNSGIEEKILKDLEDYKGEIAMQSFNPLIIKTISKLTDKYPLGLLCTLEKNLTNSKFVDYLLHHITFRFFIKFEFLSIRVNDLEKHRKRSKRHRVITWTINSEEKLKIAEKYAENIIFETPLQDLKNFEK